ncbi:MAG TPA: fibronectin type III domain-containing protein, partial [Terriglobia bacterium]|nr:fibronectin type III domain-containing protein [Terriglobia bacterium]
WKNSNESVQARYVPRFYLYNLAQRVKGFMWELVPSTDGNEDNLYGIINGKIPGPNAFKPREAYRAFEVTSALFGETEHDPMAEFSIAGVPARYMHGQLQSYAFRDKVSGQRIYAFWLAILAEPADNFTPIDVNLKVSDPDLRKPVLIDVRTGAVTPLEWQAQKELRVPLKDSVMAVADASYLNWHLVPETPGELQALRTDKVITLRWKTYSRADRLEIERSVNYGPWSVVGKIAGGQTTFQDTHVVEGHITYRLRAYNGQGSSAWSNPAWVDVSSRY